jgi:hypothetical protein
VTTATIDGLVSWDMAHRRAIVMPLVLALAALASCGSLPAAPDASRELPPLDACALLLDEDADPGGIHGLLRVRAPIELTVGQEAAKCSFGTPEPPIMVVSLEVRRLDSAAAARKQQKGSEPMLPKLSGAPVEVVEGIGDRAVWAGGRLDQLQVLAGELRLIVTVEVGEESGRRDHATRITRSALERLQPSTSTTGPP